MVSAANAHATEAGLEILRAGGTAADAAIAVQLALNLVEPQSSGIGGGAFFVHWDAAGRNLKTYDGRETAPAAARPERFLAGGEPMAFGAAVHSGLSIGTPGLVRLLETVHRRHGRLPWARLFDPAIRLADNGFQVSERLHAQLRERGAAAFDPAARRYFFAADGTPWPAGHLLANPEFAVTLRAIAAQGADAFYTGPIAAAIVAAAREAPNHAGDLTLADLAGYRAIERPPLCFVYRRHRICGMGPPSSGALAVAQTLLLVEPFDLGRGRDAVLNARALHFIAEAEKLAYADRNFYIADPDFVPVPSGLIDAGYLAERRRSIDPARAMRPPQAGSPPGKSGSLPGRDGTRESAGTSHISIVDGHGNAVAMTTTIEDTFGSRVWAAGFLLNNELTDFSFEPQDRSGRVIVNRVEAGKRPRSSMAPTIVFDEAGQVAAVLGSPGGGRIILYVAKALIALIDWQLDVQAAAALPNFGSFGGPLEVEHRAAAAFTVAPHLLALGHTLVPTPMASGLHIVVVREGRLEGGADPRREGLAKGD
ncbi:MAG: gamma-glutamyltransferase [Hyphomicrobiaceae bacterium]